MPKKKWDAFVYGDVNIDLIIPGVEALPPPGQEVEIETIKTCVGGGAALFTLGLGKLGLRPAFQGSIGDDCYGRLIRNELLRHNVDISLLTCQKGAKTGISLSFTNEKDRSFLTYRGTNSALDLREIDSDVISLSRHIHMTGYEGSKKHQAYLTILKKIKKETDVTVSFDVGWDTQGEWNREIKELFPYIDVLFMNETEALHYSRKKDALAAAEEFAAQCKMVVIKQGQQGALAVSRDIAEHAGAYTVPAIDTTGAGDSFNAGFIYGYLIGAPVAKSLRYGNACGALNVMAYGGNTGFPDRAGLSRFIKEEMRNKE